jgi:hypothetical protein
LSSSGPISAPQIVERGPFGVLAPEGVIRASERNASRGFRTDYLVRLGNRAGHARARVDAIRPEVSEREARPIATARKGHRTRFTFAALTATVGR